MPDFLCPLLVESDFKPKWVGPASILFSVVLFSGLVGLGGGLLYWNFGRGPSAEDVFFAKTLPSWWIDRINGETPSVDPFLHLPDSSLEAPLRRIDELLDRDPNGVSVESVALNQAIEQARLPFFVDVVVRGRAPLILTYRVEQRDRWSIGSEMGEVLRVDRLDRSNIVTAFTGRQGQDLPVVLLDRIEAMILNLLEDDDDGPAEALLEAELFEAVRRVVPDFDPARA